MEHRTNLPSVLRNKLLLAGVVIVVLQLCAAVIAPSPQAAVIARQTTQPMIQGTVVKHEGNTLTLRSGEMTLVTTVPTNVAVQRNWLPASTSKLAENDQVTLVQNMQGDVEKIEAVSKGVLELNRWLFPLLSGGLATAILAQALIRKLTEWTTQEQRSRGSMVHLSPG